MGTYDLDSFGFSSYDGLNGQLIAWRYEALAKYFRGRTCLELGSSDGRGTGFLAQSFARVVAVDGSHEAVASLRKRFAHRNVEAVEARFESLALSEKFDTVVMAHILEHVDDPTEVLAVAKRHLAPSGVIIADVPNANSIHRQVGVAMGMMGAVTDLNDADRSIGHQRVYTPAAFQAEFKRAGLKVRKLGGFLVKPVSNSQMEQWFEEPLTRALFDIGRRYPDIAADIFVVAARA